MRFATRKTAADFAIASFMGVALLLFSYVRVLGDSQSAAFDGKIIRTVMSQPVWGTALAGHLIAFATAMVLVHVAFGLACLGLAHLSRKAWPQSQNSVRTWMMLWFILGTLWILAANASWYPWSSLGSAHAETAALQWHGLSPLNAISTLVSGALLLLVVRLVLTKHPHRWMVARPAQSLFALCAVMAGLALFTLSREASGSQATDPNRPHVILIGLDSLRTDVAFGPDARVKVPHISEFLSQSTVFRDTMTPLARTFPSWVSILSGRHPHTTGAVINLFPRELINEGETLPELLKKGGYQTQYAIDEVRFSNLDTTYGFDRMISPPIGAADFLLGFFADSPLPNLLVNTRIGEFLFPYAHGNRAASKTYDPDTFVERLDRELDFTRPTFLAVHMTLAHWPYAWAGAEPVLGTDGQPEERPMYDQAVRRLDQQFTDVMDVLRRRGALDNAIVVVLSDHGESLGEAADPRVPREHDVIDESVKEVFGHGTNIFAEHQYQVVLGFRSFGSTPVITNPGRIVEAPASLEDIAPTLAEALGVRGNSTFDGISLLPLLQEDSSPGTVFQDRIRFTETEFNPPGIALGQTITTSALTDAAEFYRVNPVTDRLYIRHESLEEILRNRQYAATLHGRTLASVPVPDDEGQFIAYFDQPGAAPQWINAEEAAKADPEVAKLWSALNDRFPATRGPSKTPMLD